ncbi:BlaI/MecI/CopY family transcriptional regulator [Calidifontibacter sp. DB0510]|uniref:BlaI/MecI/CopY family transcriptional regulator n=1 Tax=Metallococcus carri TaxID=1656884 RepID=A0A967B4I4_9MICO|nr:BlaI/MecI/CopY family transcriptional regulator [Metallococcus carri]NHN57215.1 BlaI/MecI/CopY family transcriptional regulator [Metallococcus carri]NOP37982.1 BlaI/MecI/CopY family transcriptional regulator [Calidifontibacter sp. DB2511S]
MTRPTAGTTLGELERAIMEVLWAADRPLVVREILDELDDRDRAYTTVMTVSDRLAKKGLAVRVRDGRAWAYTAAATRSELTAQALRDTMAGWGGDESRADVLLHFLRDASPDEVARLQEGLRAVERAHADPTLPSGQ